jgi:hypothetical protein
MSLRNWSLALAALPIAGCTAALSVESAASTAALAPPPGAAPAVPPQLGQSETLRRLAGVVSVRPKGTARFTSLLGTLSVPDGSEVDARRGRVAITVATVQPGQTVTAVAYQGRFLLHQDPAPRAETHLDLTGPLSGCARVTLTHGAGRAVARIAAEHSHASKVRHLWVSEHGGSWGTDGRYVSTTVEGTRWLTIDECGRSQVKVAEGTVVVHDLIDNRVATVTSGHRYVAAAPFAEGSALVPPQGEVFAGVSGGSVSSFQRQVGKHPAIFGYFAMWNSPISVPLALARDARARLFLHLSTDIGYGGGAGEQLSPGAIAQGRSDAFLIDLGHELAAAGRPAYIALLPEMNQANNSYCAFDAGGSPRDGAHSTASYRQAWRRSVLILRGGSVAAIDRRLRALRLPPVRTARTTLESPRVAFMWAPQTAGTPDIPANAPAAYYPGSAYVDIVGTDFYSAFPNFSGLARLYSAYPSKPFGFNEWAMWQNGDPGFVRRLFAFVRSHRRIGVMVYNQGLNPNGPFRLQRFPAAADEIRHELGSSRFPPYTPEWR